MLACFIYLFIYLTNIISAWKRFNHILRVERKTNTTATTKLSELIKKHRPRQKKREISMLRTPSSLLFSSCNLVNERRMDSSLVVLFGFVLCVVLAEVTRPDWRK